MAWVILFTVLGAVSLVVLGLLTLWLWRGVKELGHAVTEAADRLAEAADALDATAAPAGPDAGPATPGEKSLPQRATVRSPLSAYDRGVDPRR